MAKVDLSEFEQLAKENPPNVRRCSVGKAQVKLTPAERQALDAALAVDKEDITASAIVAWFKRRGLVVTRSGVAHHRQGTCSCARHPNG